MPVSDPGALRRTRTAGEAELLDEYRRYVYSLANGYVWPGANRDDVRQEAMLGALYAIRTWRADGGASLKSLIALGVRRQLWVAVKAAYALKHQPLNQSARRAEDDEGDLAAIVEMLPDPRADVDRQLAVDWLLDEIKLRVSRMTGLEQRALLGVALGLTYSQIDANEKRVDNALQRARRKLADPEDAA